MFYEQTMVTLIKNLTEDYLEFNSIKDETKGEYYLRKIEVTYNYATIIFDDFEKLK